VATRFGTSLVASALANILPEILAGYQAEVFHSKWTSVWLVHSSRLAILIGWHAFTLSNPIRYSAKAGAIENLVTQPYDKILQPCRARYLSLSPYNLVRLILGERFPTDSDRDSVIRDQPPP